MVYMSLIFSYINYCNLIWGGACKSSLDSLYLLQKKAIRIVNNSEYLAHTDPIFKSLGILNIYQVFKLNCVLFAYKCLKTSQYPDFKNKKLVPIKILSQYLRETNMKVCTPICVYKSIYLTYCIYELI